MPNSVAEAISALTLDCQRVGEDLETPISYKFSYHDLRDSAGLSVQWLAPSLGIFRFSYGIALNASKGNAIDFPDRTEGFQFSVGQSF